MEVCSQTATVKGTKLQFAERRKRELELDVSISIQEALNDPKILRIVELLRLDAPVAVKLAFDGLKDSMYKTRDNAIGGVAGYESFIRKLNKEWRGEDNATDVISLSQHVPDLKLPMLMLGDIVISVETVARQAEQRGHMLLDIMRILMVHGLLHLLGFDHKVSEDTEVEMEEEEEDLLLKSLGWKGKRLIQSAYDAATHSDGLKLGGKPYLSTASLLHPYFMEIILFTGRKKEALDTISKCSDIYSVIWMASLGLFLARTVFILFYLDIQGTLLNSKSQLSSTNFKAMKEASSRANLIFCSLSAGDIIEISLEQARPAVIRVFKGVDLTGKDGIVSEFSPGVFLQGLLVYGTQGREIFRRNLDTDVCREACRYSLENEVPLITFTEDHCLSLYDHPLVDSMHTVYHEQKVPKVCFIMVINNSLLAEAEIMPSVEHLMAAAEKLVFMDTAEGVTTAMRPYWSEATGDGARVVQTVPDMLEIVPPGTSKGSGVSMLLDHLGITPKEIMAIGDGENDIEMLELACLGIALGNGVEKTKTVANVIGLSNDENGVADAIYRFHSLCGHERIRAARPPLLRGPIFFSQREYRKVRRRAAKSKEKEIELDVSICIEEGLPDDPEVLSIAELLRLNVPMAMKLAFDGLKGSVYKTRDNSINDVGGFESIELSVLLCNDEFIRKLNKEWRNEDHATDVLSLSQHVPNLKLPILMLGDIVISVETAARQAEERGHTLIDEIRVLMIHGLLHLLGFDHEISEEAEVEMEKEEELLLKSLGWKGKGLIQSAHDAETQTNSHEEKPDGTLLNSKSQISLTTAKALKEVSSRGVRVVIATGKSRSAVMKIFKEVELAGEDGIVSEFSPGVFLQGLLVYGRQGREIFRKNLDTSVCREACLYSCENKVPLIAFSKDRCFSLFEHPLLDSVHTLYNEPKVEIMPSVEHLLAEADIQKVLFMETPEVVATTLRPYWSQATGDRATVVQAVEGHLEIVPAGTSKGSGVNMLLDHLGITRNQIMAIGDGENDVEMLELASLGVALSNGSEKTKAVANAIGASNDEDGAADAIYRTMESSQSFFIAGQKPVHGTIDENVPRTWVALTENRATSKRNSRRSWKRTKNPPGSPG
ncbi:unnamed protein product [Malus baccata var. baccata]